MHKHSKKYYALKEMSKLKILDKKSEKSINSEREFLSKLNNPFIVNMHYAFQDSVICVITFHCIKFFQKNKLDFLFVE